MISLLPVLISFFIGRLFLKCFKRKDVVSCFEDLFLAFALGVGFSAQIVFYSLLIIGHIAPVVIIVVHLLVLCGLFFFTKRYTCESPSVITSSFNQQVIVVMVLMATGLMAIIIAMDKPWGDWDGWSYWSFHANFIFKAGEQWRHIFEFNIQAHHPWMLPLLIIWGWCFQPDCNYTVPLAIGVLFTISTVGLLIISLKKYIPFGWSLLAGILLISIPYYLQHGTSQYADIEATFFILLSCVLALDFFKQPSLQAAILLGICLGFTASLKDNSLVAALILLVLIITNLSKKNLSVFTRPLAWGFVAIGLSIVIMKSFEIFYSENDTYAIYWPGLWDWHKWVIIGHFVTKILVSIHWGGLWFLVLAMLLAKRWDKNLNEVSMICQFMFVYIIFYFLIFTISQLDLEWLLSSATALDRTLYLIAPSAIFTIFYAVAQND